MELNEYRDAVIDFIREKIDDYTLCMSEADSAVYIFRDAITVGNNEWLFIRYNNEDNSYEITLHYDFKGCGMDWTSPIFTERSLKYVLAELYDVMNCFEENFK